MAAAERAADGSADRTADRTVAGDGGAGAVGDRAVAEGRSHPFGGVRVERGHQRLRAVPAQPPHLCTVWQPDAVDLELRHHLGVAVREAVTPKRRALVLPAPYGSRVRRVIAA